jgi:ATP-dependent helicase HrpA
VLETPEAQAAAMLAGTRRLLLLAVPSPVRAAQAKLSNAQRLALTSAPGAGAGEVLADATTAALDALIAEAGGVAWDEAGFARLRSHVSGRLAARTGEVLGQVAAILAAAQDVRARMATLSAPAFAEARIDVAEQLGRLVHPGFATGAGAARLPDLERYVRGAERRLERLPDATAADRDRMRAVRELEATYREVRAARPRDPGVAEARWMLEELRISHFAQGLGARGQVSAKRVRRALGLA